MKFCPNCGSPLDDGDLKFCPKCGNPLISEEVTEQIVNTDSTKKQVKTKNKNIMYLLLALVLVIACLGGYFAYTKYQESEQEKERIAEQEKNKEQTEKEYADQKEKELEEKDKEIKDSLADKSNVKDTLIFSMDDKFYPYSNMIGMKIEDAKKEYGIHQVEGRNYYKDDVVSEIDVNSDGKIQNYSIYFNEPLYSQSLGSAMSKYPFMIFNKEEGYFLESGVISETGEKLQIYYYVDTNTLSVDHALVVWVEQKSSLVS